jgi:adenine phosphoribosyltransferase
MADIELVLKEKIRNIPDYPKKGIMFRDITPLLKDKTVFALCIKEIANKFKDSKIDYVAGIEARGFILGGALACALNAGFVPIRKKGKLPYKKVSIDYELEYNKETMEIHEDAVEKGSSVLIVDDLLATGGTAKAAASLIRSLGAKVIGFAFLVELSELKGIGKLDGGKVFRLVRY